MKEVIEIDDVMINKKDKEGWNGMEDGKKLRRKMDKIEGIEKIMIDIEWKREERIGGKGIMIVEVFLKLGIKLDNLRRRGKERKLIIVLKIGEEMKLKEWIENKEEIKKRIKERKKVIKEMIIKDEENG